jgi:hypothetical protein
MSTSDIQRHWPSRWQITPPTYAEATPSEALRGKGPQLALLGRAGTGKTWQLWGFKAYQEAKARVKAEESGGLLPRPCMWIISEAADIEAHRWNVEWLAAVAEYDGILAIDDLGYRCQRPDSEPSEWAAHSAYVIADARVNFRRRTIWTSNLTEARLAATYGEPTASRICSCAVVEGGGHDRRKNKGDQ